MNDATVEKQGYLNLRGTYRSCAVQDTLAKTQTLFPLLGITRVADITGLDTIGIPVITCIRPMAKHLSVSQGKGLTLELAKASAIMEAIECYHMENPPKPVITGSYNQLKDNNALVNPADFNMSLLERHYLEDYEFDWVMAVDIVTQETVYIPQILTNLDSTQLHPEYSFLSVTTNGIASGNTMAEALCHALYEVIERDSLTRFASLSQSERDAAQLDLDTLSYDNKKVLEQYRQANIPLKVWDITSLLNIPTFHCVIGDSDTLRNLSIFTGTGTHLSADVALSRALTEAAQCRLTYISGNRDDILPGYYQSRGQFKTTSTHDFDNGAKSFHQCYQPTFAGRFDDNVEQLKTALVDNGYHRIYTIDHTKMDINIPVVQVIVPGLQFNAKRM